MKSLIIILSVCFTSLAAHAYIPHSRTIIGRLARNQGKGAYAIEQEVEFKDGTNTIKLRERWVIDESLAMRLSVTGAGAKYEAVYRTKNRVVPDLKGAWLNGAPTQEFIEPFFFVRSSAEFLRLLSHSNLVPNSFSRERVAYNPNSKTSNAPEPLVRLGRVDGVIAYVFGTPPKSDEKKPAVWIEQDSFLLRKLRFPTSAEVVARNYSNFSTLKLARERQVTWDDNSANIRVLSVKPIPSAQAQKLLASTTLTANDAREARLPDVAKEFYSRFR